VSNRIAVRHLFGRALGINMNPLMITRCFSELIDSMLVDNDPIGQSDLLAFKRFGIFN